MASVQNIGVAHDSIENVVKQFHDTRTGIISQIDAEISHLNDVIANSKAREAELQILRNSVTAGYIEESQAAAVPAQTWTNRR